MATYYDMLEVSNTATQEEITAGYRLVALAWHPDRFSTERQKAVHEKMLAIQEAYTTLSDPRKRIYYDRQLVEQAVRPGRRALRCKAGFHDMTWTRIEEDRCDFIGWCQRPNCFVTAEKLIHSPGAEWEYWKEKSCITTKRCQVESCGKLIEPGFRDMLAPQHQSWGEWRNQAGTPGQQVRKCNRCSETETRIVQIAEPEQHEALSDRHIPRDDEALAALPPGDQAKKELPSQGANPVWILATRAVQERLTSDQLAEATDCLRESGLSKADVDTAQKTLAEATTASSPLVDAIGQICEQLYMAGWPMGAVTELQLCAADMLLSRLDEFSLTRAVHYYLLASSRLPQQNPAYGKAVMNEGVCWSELARLGVAPLENFERAADAYQHANSYFFDLDPKHPIIADLVMNEATARSEQAQQEAVPERNFQRSLTLFREAGRLYAELHGTQSHAYGKALQNQAATLAALACNGVAPIANLQQTINLSRQVERRFAPGNPNFKRAQLLRNHCIEELAALDVEPEKESDFKAEILALAEHETQLNADQWAMAVSSLRQRGISTHDVDEVLISLATTGTTGRIIKPHLATNTVVAATLACLELLRSLDEDQSLPTGLVAWIGKALIERQTPQDEAAAKFLLSRFRT